MINLYVKFMLCCNIFTKCLIMLYNVLQIIFVNHLQDVIKHHKLMLGNVFALYYKTY